LSIADQRLVKEIVFGVCRNLTRLDYYICVLSQRPLEKVDLPVLWILRISLYQVEFMRIPSYAVVHQAGELCRGFKKSSARAFVNAILRRYLRQRPALPEGSSASELSVRFSHPDWLVRRYLSRYGESQTKRILRKNNEIPESILWVNPFKIAMDEFEEKLREERIPFQPLVGQSNAVKVEAQGFARHPLVQNGYCFFMDPCSQRVASLGNLEACETIGDFCAAPGGKTFLLASRARADSRIVCSDVDPSRLQDMRCRAELCGVAQLSFLRIDLRVPVPFVAAFDFILLDVPCSGTGTLRSNPDLRWSLEESDLVRFHSRQAVMLRHSFAALRPNRELVYATCSTEPEENEEVVEGFLASEPKAQVVGDYFRSFPGAAFGGGFFAARVRRS
jgi:16S rRNA (cytosine967-C5)-methyltransferase